MVPGNTVNPTWAELELDYDLGDSFPPKCLALLEVFGARSVPGAGAGRTDVPWSGHRPAIVKPLGLNNFL